MEIASWLTDVYGARLTGSPSRESRRRLDREEAHRVGDGERQARDVGTVRPRVDERADGGAGRVAAPVPDHRLRGGLDARARTEPVKADVVMMKADSAPDLEKYRGKLRGKIVFTQPPRDSVPPHFIADASRLADTSLSAMGARAVHGRIRRGGGGPNAGGNPQAARFQARRRSSARSPRSSPMKASSRS